MSLFPVTFRVGTLAPPPPVHGIRMLGYLDLSDYFLLEKPSENLLHQYLYNIMQWAKYQVVLLVATDIGYTCSVP